MKKYIEPNCFGTKEYSEKSGICCNCRFKKRCGKNGKNN